MVEVELPAVPALASAESLFRYQVISFVLARELWGEVRAAAVETACGEPFITGAGQLRATSRRTIYRWLAAYEKHGLAGLEPRARSTVEASRVLSPTLVDFLRSEKSKDSAASIPEVLRRARVSGVLDESTKVNRATVYRAAVRMGLSLTDRSTKRDQDMRRFAFPHRMMMVMVDGKHFRAGQSRLRRVAFFFLDDATRYVLGAVVGPSESATLCLRGLYEVVRHHGIFDVLFFDLGAGFRAHDTLAVARAVGIRPIHGKAKYPEGRAKVERLNRTVWNDILRGLRAPDVDPDCRSLELRLRHYFDTQYNIRPHESLDGDTPRKRWERDARELSFSRSDEQLRERFLLTEARKVSLDNIVSVGGTPYEVPRGYGGKRIPVRRHTLTEQVSIVHEGKPVRLHPVDLAKNADARRATAKARQEETEPSLAPSTAAMRAFDRDFGPVPIPTKNKE